MANEVACPVCQKKYTVGPEMAGRKVRCRQCANVFTVAGAHVAAMADPPPEQQEDNTTPPVPPPPSIFDAQAQFEQALNRDIQQPKLRPSTKFKFPWAAQLDDWLPTALIVVGVVWSAFETFRSDIGPVWAKLLRLVVIFGLYAGVVIPITMIGIRKMSMKLAYALPPMTAWRAAATYTLPALLGYLTWVALVHPASFAIGCLLGLIFAAGAFWFLFRVDPQKELVPSFGVATGSFVGSLICCGIIMWVLNMVLFGVMKSNHTADTVKISPIGPSFAWNVETPIPQRRATGSDSDSSDDTQTTPQVVRQDAQTSNPARGSSAPSKANPPANDPLANNASEPAKQSEPVAVTAASEKIAPSTASPTTLPALPPISSDKTSASTSKTVFDGINDEASNTPHSVTPDPVVKSDDTKFVADLKSRQLPFVRDVSSPRDLDTFDELVYPATTSSFMAVVTHKDQSQDAVELRNAATFERLAIVLFPRENNNDLGPRRYALSPDGQYMVRPASFPRPMFQVWSFKEQRVVSRAYLGDGNSSPLLLGFIDNEHYLTQCLVQSANYLQVRETRTGLVIHSTQLPPYNRSPGNSQISSDGKMFALATRMGGQAQVLLFDPMHPTIKPRICRIAGLSDKFAVDPVGIAFSQDSSRLAAMFASQGEAYVVAWNRDGSIITDQVCPGIAPPQQDSTSDLCGGRVFDWVGNNVWLIGGTSFVDPLSGKLMVNLVSMPVKGEHCVDRDTWQLEYPTGQGKDRLAVVQLDATKLAPYAKR
jgi:hypothetical protein